MNGRASLLLLSLVITAAGLAGCYDCGDAGCDDTVDFEIVTADGAPVTTFEGTAFVRGLEMTFVCEDGRTTGNTVPEAMCGDNVIILYFARARDIEIHVASSVGSFSGEVDLDYDRTTYPNGRGCAPVCKNATERIVLE